MSRPTDEELYEAYVYLLGRALVIRQEITDLSEDGIDYNRIKYNPVGDAEFVNPNLDVAYLEAWVAVDQDATAILTVPEIEGRYYTAQISDEWGEVITNINERTMPDTPHGDFVLHAPGVNPPAAHGEPIELRSNKAKILARVEIGDDLPGAIRLQNQFGLRTEGKPVIEPPVDIPFFDNATLVDSRIFDINADILDSAPDPMVEDSEERRDLVEYVNEYVASGPAERADIDGRITGDVVPKLRIEATLGVTTLKNGWIIGNVGGHYGPNFHVRTAANLIGIWANSVEEAVYFVGTRDINSQPFAGGTTYSLRFEADSLPEDEVDAWWSVILVSIPDFRVVENEKDRYNLNSYSHLQREPDGALQIDIAPEPVPGRPESNWLPSPYIGNFSLTFRLYVPHDDAIDGDWFPPALEPKGDS